MEKARDNAPEQGKVISLIDLWDIFVKRFWLMLLAAILVVSGMYVFIKLTYVPEYQCKATLYILKQNHEENVTVSSSDFSLALNIVKDCTYFLKCHDVLDTTIDNLGLDISYNELYSKVSTNNPDGTRVLEVTAKAASPELAKAIVDEVCVLGSEKITQSFGYQQTNFCEMGILNNKPSNKTGLKYYAIAGILAAALIYGIFFIIYILDDSISSDEDIEKYLGLSILGEVPNFNESKDGKYGYRKYGKGYYKHSYGSSAQGGNMK